MGEVSAFVKNPLPVKKIPLVHLCTITMALMKVMKQGHVRHKAQPKLLPAARKAVVAKQKESRHTFQHAIHDATSDIQQKAQEIAVAHHKSVTTVQTLLYTTTTRKRRMKVKWMECILVGHEPER